MSASSSSSIAGIGSDFSTSRTSFRERDSRFSRTEAPFDCSFMLWSAANSVHNKSKCCGSNLVLGFESIFTPFDSRNSTKVGKPTLSSLAAFPNLIGFPAIK